MILSLVYMHMKNCSRQAHTYLNISFPYLNCLKTFCFPVTFRIHFYKMKRVLCAQLVWVIAGLSTNASET